MRVAESLRFNQFSTTSLEKRSTCFCFVFRSFGGGGGLVAKLYMTLATP